MFKLNYRGLGACPQEKFKIMHFEIDFDGILTYKKQSSVYQSSEFRDNLKLYSLS